MSPELELEEEYDSKVDIFSLGLIFLELLVPFATHMERVQTLLHAKKGTRPAGFDEKNPREVSQMGKRLMFKTITMVPTTATTEGSSCTRVYQKVLGLLHL